MPATIDTAELARRQQAGDEVALIDVREAHEYRAGHVPGALSIPMSVLPVRLAEIPRDRPIHLICQSGGRSAQVASWLEPQGFEPINVAGGTAAWVAGGGPVRTGMGA